MGHLPEADTTDAELTEYGTRTPADVAAGVATNGIFGLAVRFLNQTLFSQKDAPCVCSGCSQKGDPCHGERGSSLSMPGSMQTNANARLPRAPSCGSR